MTNQEIASLILEGRLDPSVVFNGLDPQMEQEVQKEIFTCIQCGRWKKIAERIDDLFDHNLCRTCEHHMSLPPSKAGEKLASILVGNYRVYIHDYALDNGFNEDAVEVASTLIDTCYCCGYWFWLKDLTDIGDAFSCRECLMENEPFEDNYE